jgi:hypothetical protein
MERRTKSLFSRQTLLETRRWVYYLNERDVRIHGGQRRFRVCIVFENEPGYLPTGGGDVEPWYWDQRTCDAQNKKRGFNKRAARQIVSSSMFPPRTIPSAN